MAEQQEVLLSTSCRLQQISKSKLHERVSRLTLSADNKHFGLQCRVHLSYFDMSNDWGDSHMDQHHLHEKTPNQNALLQQKIWLYIKEQSDGRLSLTK